MARYEFNGDFYFATQNALNQFGNAVQNYIDSNPDVFFGYPPINRTQLAKDRVTPFRKVQARFSNRQQLDDLFADIKTQAQNRGAIVPSTMWLGEVADDETVTTKTGADAPSWVDYDAR